MTSCLNCGKPVQENYCAHCGQKTGIHRLTWHTLVHEFLHFFTHIEEGFLRTSIMLVFKPGQLFKDYLDGKRKSYHKPVSFLLIWIGLFLLVYHLVGRFTHFPSENTETLFTNNPETASIISKYRTLIEVLIMPFTSLVAWLVVARPRLNYVELLTVNFYIISLLFILLIIQFLIAWIAGLNYKTNTFDLISIFSFVGWTIYAGIDFYSRYNIKYAIPRYILSLMINVIIYFFLSKLIVKIIIEWGKG